MTFFTAVFGELTFVFLCLVRKLLKCFQICSLFVWASVDFQGWLCSRVEEVDNPCPLSLCLHLGPSLGRTEGSDMKERPSPTPSLSHPSLCFLHWLPHQILGTALYPPFAQSLLGLSFPAAKEEKFSVFPQVKKLNCAFMAEELWAVSASSHPQSTEWSCCIYK